MNSNPKIVHEKILHAPVDMVWKALTDREQLKQWYFDFPESYRPEAGQVFDWYGGDPEGKQWQHRGKMLEVVPGRKLVHTWEYVGYPGSSIVSWELEPVNDDTTRLLFTHEFVIPFDPSMDVFNQKNFENGWNAIIHAGLVDFLKNR